MKSCCLRHTTLDWHWVCGHIILWIVPAVLLLLKSYCLLQQITWPMRSVLPLLLWLKAIN